MGNRFTLTACILTMTAFAHAAPPEVPAHRTFVDMSA